MQSRFPLRVDVIGDIGHVFVMWQAGNIDHGNKILLQRPRSLFSALYIYISGSLLVTNITLLVAKIIFVVAEITFKVVANTSSVVKITFAVGINFKVAVASSVSMIIL